MRDNIIALASETVMPDRAQALVAETGALVCWINAEASKELITKEIETICAIGSMLQ